MTKPIKIESGIPIPERGVWRPIIRRMKVKQSFTVDTRQELRSVLTAARSIGVKVTSRKIDGKHIRIWRVK